MEENTFDKSGIRSLAGFSFQIKYFILLASTLSEGEYVEFETIDDVAKLSPEKIDSVDGCIIKDESYEAIQVKHTSLSKGSIDKILYNWIVLAANKRKINRYVLVVDSSYGNENLIAGVDSKKFVRNIIKKSKKYRSNSAISKVKEIFNAKTEEDCISLVEEIKQNFVFKSTTIDQDLWDAYADHFRRAHNAVYYEERLKWLVQKITMRILESVENLNSFSLDYKTFIDLLEEGTTKFTDEDCLPDYDDAFKAAHSVDLKSTKVTALREFHQLQYCTKNEKLIEANLLFNLYYKEVRRLYLLNSKTSKCEGIENSAYDNFIETKEDLKQNPSKGDTPYNRLRETQNKQNSVVKNDQIRKGVCIYLTGKSIDLEKQISWKDE